MRSTEHRNKKNPTEHRNKRKQPKPKTQKETGDLYVSKEHHEMNNENTMITTRIHDLQLNVTIKTYQNLYCNG